MRNCKNCGKELISDNHRQKYCSQECKKEYYKLNPKHTKVCENCGKKFKTNDARYKFCSYECSCEAHRTHTETYICKYCGKEFKYKNNSDNLYCSKECDVNDKSLVSARKKLITALNKIKINKCQHCGKEFKSLKSLKYCSDECRNESNRLRAAITKINRLHHDKNKCLICGKEFKYEYKRHSYKYCSKECLKESRRRFKKISKYNRKKRIKAAFVEKVIPSKIYERDNYTCMLCGKALMMDKQVPHPKAPTIDHIIPLAKGGTHEPANVQAAHFECNWKKRDEYYVENNGQLKLF